MDETQGLALFDAKSFGKKLLSSWAYILLGLVIVLTVMSGYTDVSLDLMATVNIGAGYAVLLISCYAAMYSLDAIAKKRGEEDKRYIAAIEKIDAVRARIKKEDGDVVQTFCEEYRAAELACARKQILAEAMLNEEDLAAFAKSGKLPAECPLAQKLALKRARACRPIKLNRFMIGRPLTAKKQRESFETPEQSLGRDSIVRVITTAITVLFPVSISMSVIVEPNLATLVEGILKLFTIALAGAKAYNGRLKIMVEVIPQYAALQEDIADRFDAWKMKKRPATPEGLK